ncbi:accessory Sec system protein Asp2 [Clostridium sp. MB05]|uniref:accessory Sec system protein Asp2 n=1 Tax=Clostridium sp. MB05 TaxID=3376682 RepID=UPI0039826727
MAFKQKVYIGKKYKIKYLFENNSKSKDLIIIFTSCIKPGQKARYNYIRTLDNFECNKLFILDDFGFDGRGAYYLGKDNDFDIEKDLESLINSVITNLNPDKKIFLGSSKGGYAALYFGIKYNKSIIISGAPQYILGNYLNYPNHRNILKYIMSDTNLSSIELLNNLLRNNLEKYNNNDSTIYLHYSTNEETYDSDISVLIKDMKTFGIQTYYDIHTYNNHSDLTNFFPEFIKSTLKDILSYK